MIRLQDISKSFGPIKALENISLEVPVGQITILAGADGSGKSTLFKIIIGLMRPDGGQIFLKNEAVNQDKNPISSICGYMPEQFSLYPDLSVEENMNFFADIHQVPYKLRESRKEKLLKKTGMIKFRSRRAGALSGGMKQKLALSTILLAAPELIILDEPTTGVDPLSRIEFFNIINDLKVEGKTIIISTPYLDEAEKGDYIVFFKEGHIIKQDTIARLRSDFPAKLYRIQPKENIFMALEKAQKREELKRNVYIRGKYLKFLKTSNLNFPADLPILSIEEEPPMLEDIYLFYERQNG